MDIIRIIFAIILPPISALLTVGISLQLLLNIVLCCFGWLPGSIHAVWLLVRKT